MRAKTARLLRQTANHIYTNLPQQLRAETTLKLVSKEIKRQWKAKSK